MGKYNAKALHGYELQQGAIALVSQHVEQHNHSVPANLPSEQADLLYHALLYLPDTRRGAVGGLAEQLIQYFSRQMAKQLPFAGGDLRAAEAVTNGLRAYNAATFDATANMKIAKLAALFKIDVKQLESILAEAKARP